MVRLFLLFLVVAAFAAGAAWFTDNPGDVAVNWQGQRFEMSLAVALFGVLGAAILLGMLWTALRFILRLPSILSIASGARQRRRGLQSVTKGLVAVGSGDGVGAMRHAGDARRLLGRGPLTLLLEAQAAQLSGDRDRARKAFAAMAQETDTKILGLRGLYIEAQRAGDAEAARNAASEAVAVAPSAAWANEAVLTDRFAMRDWQGARTALERAERLRVLDKPTSKRHRAVLLTAEAQDMLAAQPAEALKKAQEAASLAPDLVPAVALAGRLLGEKGDLRKATRLIEAAWRAGPHPDLADAYVHVRPGDSTHDRLQRAESLAKLAPRDPESALTVAQAALAARDLSRARAALEPVLASRPTIRACTLMAEIEDQDGHPGLAKAWLARLPRVARDRAWVADGHVSRFWSPVSPVTGRLDAFVWADPPQDAVAVIGPPDEDLTALPSVADLAPVVTVRDAQTAQSASEAGEASPAAAVRPMPESGIGPAAGADSKLAAMDAVSPSDPVIEGGTAPRIESSAGAVTAAAGPASPTPPGRAKPPTPVIFPVPHAPDDPGPEAASNASRRWRVFGG